MDKYIAALPYTCHFSQIPLCSRGFYAQSLIPAVQYSRFGSGGLRNQLKNLIASGSPKDLMRSPKSKSSRLTQDLPTSNSLDKPSHNTPDCTGEFVKNGKYKGVQRYICPLCRKTFSDSPKRRGRPIKDSVAMSGRLRVKLCRERKNK